MRYLIDPSKVLGTIEIPPSKSHTLRAILFGLLGEGKTIIRKYLKCSDTISMVEAIKTFGAKVHTHSDYLEVYGIGSKPKYAKDVINAGNSGQVLRFIGAIAALIPSYTVITGDHSIRYNRPIKPLLNGLNQLNVFAKSMTNDGYAPIIIKGPMEGGKVKITGEDSQPVSGLIIAAAFSDHITEIHVTNPGEKPWIDLTLYWLNYLGIKYHNINYKKYILKGKSSYKGFDFTVPGDLSSMAFPLAAALVTHSDLTLNNIDTKDIQGDKKLLKVLQLMGANIQREKHSITVKPSSLYGKKIDINDYIDAIAILAVIGCYTKGKLEIYNATIARSKECDRIYAITTELKKMGADIEEKKDGLIVRHSKLKGANLKGHEDHRIVMALSVAALGAEGQTIIDNVDCVKKTYPNFARDMQKIGANIKAEN